MNKINRTYLFKSNSPARRFSVLIVLFVLFFSFPAFSQVKATLDTTSLKIGEEFIYSIEVKIDSTETVQFPEEQSFLPLEVIEFYPTDTTFESNKTRLIKKYGLTQFDSGRYVLPQQQVLINERVFYKDTLLVEVADVVVDTLKQPMFDIKPFIDVPPVKTNWLKYLLWALMILAIIAGFVYLILRQKKKREEARQQLPPFEEALVALQTLDNSAFLKENKLKDYYSSLTEIVKRYLDREVDEAALESTTDELITKLEMHKDAGHLEFDRATINRLKEILKRADLIKFAKMQMESGQAQLDRTDIEEIIKETHESIPEPTEEEKLKDELYKEELLKKKQKKNILIGLGVFTGVLIMSLFILTLTYGWQEIKERSIGHPTKELLETEWVKSEYGSPAIILETPKVLTRQDMQMEDELKELIASIDVFGYGSILGRFTIVVGTNQYKQAIEPNLEAALEGIFVYLENEGARNILVDQNPFSTNKGINGILTEGSFDFQPPNKKTFKGKLNYKIILFSQTGVMQQIFIVYDPNDTYAEKLITRITNSIEIEVIK